MSTIKSSTTLTTAYSVEADTTGTLVFQTGAGPTTAVTVGTDQSVTFAQAANLPNTFGFKNRIINGGMVIDQRNAGASVTPTNGVYSVDRWKCLVTQASKYTVQQNAGSVTPPAGYTKYLGATSSSAYSVVTGDYFVLYQIIEGLNVSDLAWGSASAVPVSLSFWVRSSLTGTLGGSVIATGGSNYSYPFTFTVSSANTWEYKTILVPANTYNTINTDTNGGVQVVFNLGTGTTYSGTANTWQSGYFLAPTGATSVVGTNGATFYITGVQLEKGSTATSFDYRPYGTELQLCQRYYQIIKSLGAGGARTSTDIEANIQYLQQMRSTPTIALSAVYIAYDLFGNGRTQSSISVSIGVVGYSNSAGAAISLGNFTGMTQGHVMWSGNGGNILLSSEL